MGTEAGVSGRGGRSRSPPTAPASSSEGVRLHVAPATPHGMAPFGRERLG